MICNNCKFAINVFAINTEKVYRLCTLLIGEGEKLKNKRKFAISMFAISEFYCTKIKISIFFSQGTDLGTIQGGLLTKFIPSKID